MSPQSRAATATATFSRRDDGMPGNACPAPSSVAAIARAASVEYALHKIESESSAATQALDGASSPTLSRKRSCASLTRCPKPKNQPFLSSYGSAFLSGIFADIAQASGDDEAQDPASAGELPQPAPKKARTAAPTSFCRLKSCSQALSGLAAGADVHEVSSPSVVVSPRPNMSAPKIQRLNQDQVRELQDLAFPSLPQFPHAVSTSSLSSGSPSPRSMGGETSVEDDGDSPSYGWFVSMDGEDDELDGESPPSASFLPDTKPADLAFPALPSGLAGEEDLEVQQALAADTIDDVLGDLF